MSAGGIAGALSGGRRALLMRALGRTVYRRLEWVERRLDEPATGITALVPIASGYLSGQDAPEIAALRSEPCLDEIRARFGRGDRCFGARCEGRLVSLTWLSTGAARIDYLGLAVRLQPGTVFQHDRYTDPAVRGLRIAPSSSGSLCSALAEEGFDVLAGCILRENVPALSNARRAGFEPVATIGWVRIGPVRRAFRRPSGAAKATIGRPEPSPRRTPHAVGRHQAP